MADEPIAVGDIVKFKTGLTKMVVTKVRSEEPDYFAIYDCAWMTQDNEYKKVSLYLWEIVRAANEESPLRELPRQ